MPTWLTFDLSGADTLNVVPALPHEMLGSSFETHLAPGTEPAKTEGEQGAVAVDQLSSLTGVGEVCLPLVGS